MKKQIFTFTLFVMAVFAGMTDSFGQTGATYYSDPRTSACQDDALHPMAGNTYEYTATANVTGTFHFWATKDPNFITTDGSGNTTINSSTALTTASGDLIYTSSNYNTPGATETVEIAWSTALLNATDYQGTPGSTPSPTFVAVYFAADDGCSDNFKIYELDPLNGFTVDILALDPAALSTMPTYGAVPEQCTDIVRGATYTGGSMEYDYGTNYLYYEFVAANFTGYWVPTFAIDAGDLSSVQNVTYEYTYSHPDTWGTTPPTWTALETGVTQINVDPSVTTTGGGVSVFVRVTLEHNNYENINGQTLTMVLDGQNSEDQWDVVNVDCTDPGAPDQNDTADQTITARPTVTPGTSSTITPNTTLVPGNEVNTIP